MEQANSIKRYLEILERYKPFDEVYYRGQLEKFHSITPSLSRNKGFLENESNIYFDSIAARPEDFPDANAPLENLSKMQHYSIPTRLIDLTIDPLVALYFAVENTEDTSASCVYIFIQQGKEYNDKNVKLLSVLAILSNFDYDAIRRKYYDTFNEHIENEEISKFSNNPVFVKHCEELKRANRRLHNQGGAFFLCANHNENGIIRKELIALDSINPMLVIRIPYEHKKRIKQDLELRKDISVLNIYPEITSASIFIKDKYQQSINNNEIAYLISESQIISRPDRWIALTITLKNNATIEQVRAIAIKVLKEKRETRAFNAIWVKIACTTDDAIVSNWILRGLWFNRDRQRTPRALKECIGDDIYLEEESAYSILSDYYDKYFFNDDKMLFVCNIKLLIDSSNAFKIIQNALTNYQKDNFVAVVMQITPTISKALDLHKKLGGSRNQEFQNFIRSVDSVILNMCCFRSIAMNTNVKTAELLPAFTRLATEIIDELKVIHQSAGKWEKILEIRQSDFALFSPEDCVKPEYQYEQTLPINPNGLVVSFNVDIKVLSLQSFQVSGRTNLYDHADIMLSVIHKNGRYIHDAKTRILNGCFKFPVSTSDEFENASLYGRITLPTPQVHDKRFSDLAGMEYENLSGPLVIRDGFGPTVIYDFLINME